MTNGKSKADSICQKITAGIIAEIEKGTIPWRKPWDDGGAGISLPLRSCGTPYRGVNVVALWHQAMMKGYTSPFWMTYRQAQSLGGQVRKGERGATVIKVGTVIRESDDGGDPTRFNYLRAYSVFNADQVSDLADKYRPEMPTPRENPENAELMAWFRRLNIGLEVSGAPKAFYDPARDVVHMPPESCFRDAKSHSGVLLHEVVHATGAKHRLDRKLCSAQQVDYAKEELIAELGSAFTGAMLGVEPRFEDNAAYIASWLTILKNDSRAILKASSAAQAACDWIVEKGGSLATPVFANAA